MKKIKAAFIILFLFIPHIAHAGSPSTIYEPHTFTREIAKPERATDTFEACDPKGSFRLIVVNGDEKGENLISSGVISVNGLPIITQSDFNQKVSRIERPLSNITEENSITVELGSKPWSQVTVSVEGIMSCLEVTINEPQEGATINRGSTIVKGTLESQTADVGVVVNGVLAEVNGENWFALVPLKEGENILKAVATDGSGNSDDKSVTVSCGDASQPVEVSALPASGIAPMDVSFNINTNTAATVSRYLIDFDGDGTIDLETTEAENVTYKYETAGLYLPLITIEDTAGNTYSESVVVNAQSLESMDTLFKNKWSGLKEKLASVDKDGALDYFSDSARDKYGRVFNDLGEDLPSIVSTFGEIGMNSIEGEIAEYVTIREQDGGKFAYFIYYMRDSNGIWKIRGM